VADCTELVVCAGRRITAAVLLAAVCAPVGYAHAQSHGADARTDTVGLAPQRLTTSQPRRTWLEFGVVYGTAVGMYHFDGRHRHTDRSFSESVPKILSPSRLRFDDNIFTMNNVGHPVGGLLYYGAPRLNGASATRSFATLLGASVFWEQVVELQEIAAINDHISTPISGWVLGEALFQNRLVFQRASGSRVHRVLGFTFGAPLAATEVLRARPAAGGAREHDAWGLPADVERQFRVYAGVGQRAGAAVLGTGRRTEVGLQTEVQPVGRRDAAGAHSGWFTGTGATQLDVHVAFDNGGVVEWRALARVVPAGWYGHRVAAGGGYHGAGEGNARGGSLLVGPFGAFELQQNGIAGHLYMAQLAAYMLGVTFDGVAVHGPVRARLVLDGAATFANATPTGLFAYPVEQHAGESTVFRYQGYVHAWGGSGGARTALNVGPVALTGHVRTHHLRSLDSRDRMPDVATAVSAKRDRWLVLGGDVLVRPVPWLETSAAYEHAGFRGRIAEHTHAHTRYGWSVRAAVAVPHATPW
jgi:hypothetical protein